MSSANSFVLGIDLGSDSLGFALVDMAAREVVHTGVRIFSGPFTGDFESGKDESTASVRRSARQQRRQTERRKKRMSRVFSLLQGWGLLPDGVREVVLPEIDRVLQARYVDVHTVPYFFRKRALDERLEPYELGRTLYHLAQRRGFRGRASIEEEKTKPTEKEATTFKQAISQLESDIETSGSRTLGEYFASLDPEQQRIRGRRTHRKMFEAELDAIWDSQAAHHPAVLTRQNYEQLRTEMFYQRPLKRPIVGHCSLEPDQPRAPLYSLAAQRYRLITTINHLRLRQRDTDRPLHPEERRLLLE